MSGFSLASMLSRLLTSCSRASTFCRKTRTSAACCSPNSVCLPSAAAETDDM